MDMLDRRLNDKGKNWRHVAKALTVLDFVVRAGSENVVLWSKDNLYIIKTLREFQYVDEEGHDQGTIIRVKAKELTSLLRDDERLRTERSMRNDRRRRRRPERRQSLASDGDDEEGSEDELQRALEESRRTAEEDERRRTTNVSDDGLSTAIKLSREEEEARRAREAQQQNLLDLSGPQQGQFDIFGNPINPINTGYLQNAYGNDYMQQLQQQQYLQQQQQQQQQQEYIQQQMLQQQMLQQQQQQQQQEYLQQQYLQQQMLQQQQQQQQQMQLQEQQQLPLKTGSNNPFAANGVSPAASAPASVPVHQAQEQPAMTRTPTGSQRKNEEHSELNTLLANGTGIDTFGNEGNLRIPAQFTKPSNFISSSGTGIRTQNSTANPFMQKQYTGVASTGIIPSYTGYGFGNQGQQPQQQQQGSQSQPGEQSLIDI